ncbi:UNVERIFIED_CONTAM: hypothetical protein GTU68_050002 [Idotea baltica]|nr:hypothetical protein [Idotea baltica]
MRSRFSAYVLGNPQYIYRTWDENTRPPLTVLREENSQVFTQLKIISTTQGGVNDEIGTVEFIASYTFKDDGTNGSINRHHENSTFSKQKNRWVYVNAIEIS